ncbi:MAG: pilus assembly protein TadG-related protein [Vicinamibacterales bacterium]
MTWGGYRRGQRGMSLVFVALGLMGFIAATMLAIDVGMLMTARNQAQNSADAGALAGAVGLGFNDYNDRSATGPAVTSALGAAKNLANGVMYDPDEPVRTAVSVLPADVEFENDPTGEPNRVKVTVRRNEERGNPLSTIIAAIFGVTTANISATATAEVSKANAMDCVKPFTIPDKWREMNDPPMDSETSTFEVWDNRGNPLPNPDVYMPADVVPTTDYTGYNAQRDKGTRLMIRAGTGNNITPSFYFSITLGQGGGPTGADAYRWNIANCNSWVQEWDGVIIQEPGNMNGPTIQGAEDLKALDPSAQWDEGCDCIVNSRFGANGDGWGSPRKFPIPLYDPLFYAEGKRNGRFADLKVAGWIGFFLEEIQGNNIWGRITPIAGKRTGEGPWPEGTFPIAIRLIK